MFRWDCEGNRCVYFWGWGFFWKGFARFQCVGVASDDPGLGEMDVGYGFVIGVLAVLRVPVRFPMFCSYGGRDGGKPISIWVC